MNILILGVNGFIGHHLSSRILENTPWHVYGMDMRADRLTKVTAHPRFHFFEGDIAINREWVEYHIKKCDVILPLVAIATPADYVRQPLAVFELDFQANLPIVQACVRYRKRVIFPSTSEVYGMSSDAAFHPYESSLVLGPIHKQRWIYSCAKQLMDRVIWAYGQESGLDFTLIRPFNWIGSGLDNLHTPKEGSSRVVTQFLGHIARGEPLHLVDGGRQRRSFTDIDDGIDALMRIIENPNKIASGKIYNIGNPANDLSIRELAELMLKLAEEEPAYRPGLLRTRLVEMSSVNYYGDGYQDIQTRVPWIENTRHDLGWTPRHDITSSLRRIFAAYRDHVEQARALLTPNP
ncbi:MAG: bifunctional UDP-4-keto-pentose/UDP-xylose synthase [Magnetococcus sp. YQC-5]